MANTKKTKAIGYARKIYKITLEVDVPAQSLESALRKIRRIKVRAPMVIEAHRYQGMWHEPIRQMRHRAEHKRRRLIKKEQTKSEPKQEKEG